jgi:nucleotide-binding universal stress UspA family protein
MPRIGRILLPIDFQDPSKHAVYQAAVLARHFHSEIVMLHVVTPLSYSAGMLEGDYVPANLADLPSSPWCNPALLRGGVYIRDSDDSEAG